MKTQKNIHEISDAINANPLEVTDRQLFNSFSLPVWVAIAISISLGAVTQTASAENTGSDEGNRGYRYIPIVGESTAGSASQHTKKSSSAKSTDSKGSTSSEQSSKESSPAKGINAKDSTSSDQSATESSPAKDISAKDSTSGDQSATKSSPAKGTNAKDPTSGDPSAQTEPVSKAADGKGLFPTFAEADSNSDHYITKEELKNYPDLLQIFDKVDAGKDGKLEQHEYQNLEMETKREGEVR